MRPLAARLPFLVVALTLAACGSDNVEGPPPRAPETLRLTSPSFANGETIPMGFTCDGAGQSPPLRWSGVPARARELALLVEDPDAGNGSFVHWTVYGMAPKTAGIPLDSIPVGARTGQNSTREDGYEPPCPPREDEPHRYVFTLYALARTLPLKDGASGDEVRSAIAGQAIAQGRLVGRYRR